MQSGGEGGLQEGISCCHVYLLAQGVSAEVVSFALFLARSCSLLRQRGMQMYF